MTHMTHPTQINHKRKSHDHRSGFTLTEVVVAASLLAAVMGIVAPLTVRCGRMWQDTQHQQMAMDEMVNQLERLTALRPAERQRAIAELTTSPHLGAVMPGSELSIKTMSEQDGERLVLSLTCRAKEKPLQLVAWIHPREAPQIADREVGQ